MLCQKCKIENEGAFCKKCGRKLVSIEQNNNADFIVFVFSIIVFILCSIGYMYSSSTFFEDLNGKYTYSGRFSSHEISILFLYCFSIFIMLISLILMVKYRKSEVNNFTKVNHIIVAFAFVILFALVLWTVLSSLSHLHTCDQCGNIFFGTVETDLFNSKVFCQECGKHYWSF